MQRTDIKAKGNSPAPTVQQQLTAVSSDKSMSDTEKSALMQILSAPSSPAQSKVAQQAGTLQK